MCANFGNAGLAIRTGLFLFGLFALIVAARPQSLRVEWSELMDHPGIRATVECVAATPQGGVRILFSPQRSAAAEGSQQFSLLSVGPDGRATAPGLLPVATAPSLILRRGGCASLSNGDLFVVGSLRSTGELAFFSVDERGRIAASGKLLGPSDGWSPDKVIRTSRDRLLAVGSRASSDARFALVFDSQGNIEWKLDASAARGVTFQDVLEMPNGDFVLCGFENSDPQAIAESSNSIFGLLPKNLWVGRVSKEGKLLAERRPEGLECRLMLRGATPILIFDRGQIGTGELVQAELSESLEIVEEHVMLESFARAFSLPVATFADSSVLALEARGEQAPVLYLFGPKVGRKLDELAEERLQAALPLLIASGESVFDVATDFQFADETEARSIVAKTRVTKIVVEVDP